MNYDRKLYNINLSELIIITLYKMHTYTQFDILLKLYKTYYYFTILHNLKYLQQI